MRIACLFLVAACGSNGGGVDGSLMDAASLDGSNAEDARAGADGALADGGLDGAVLDAGLPPAPAWARRFGNDTIEEVSGIAVDGSSNIFITGRYEGFVDFGGGPIGRAVGETTVFVASFDPSGVYRWAHALARTQGGTAVTTDAAGDVFVTGMFVDSSLFGGDELIRSSGRGDVFVARFTTTGALVWVRGFGDGGWDGASGIAVDGSGGVFITGSFEGGIDFGGTPMRAGETDMFVAGLSTSDGSQIWANRFGGVRRDHGRSVAVDGLGNVIVTGASDGGTSAQKILIASYGSDGTLKWSKEIGGGGVQRGMGVVADEAGNLYVSGILQYTADFGGGEVSALSTFAAFVVSYAADGTYLWDRVVSGASTSVQATGIARSGRGHLYVTGEFVGEPVDFGGGELTADPIDVFVASYASDGTYRWAYDFSGSLAGAGIGVDSAGSAVVTGLFQETVDFGSHTLSSDGVYDIFLVKFAP